MGARPAFSIALAVAIVIGALTAIAELLPRYQDEPFRAVLCVPGILYIAFNSVVSVIAFLTLLFTAGTGVATDSLDQFKYALLGGLGGVVLLRTTIVSPKGEGGSAQIGPGNVIIAFQSSIDRQIDRLRARKRARLVKASMANMDFDKAKLYILTMITGSMQNLSSPEQEELGKRVGEIDVGKTSNREKAYALGFVVLNKLGEFGLKELFDNTDNDYRTTAAIPTPSLAAQHAISPASSSTKVNSASTTRDQVVEQADVALNVSDRFGFADAVAQLKKGLTALNVDSKVRAQINVVIDKYESSPEKDDKMRVSGLARDLCAGVGCDLVKKLFNV